MKKILLFIGMFMFMTNVNALTFNVDLTNIEDKGNNGTIGSITNIDIPNKTVDAYFQDIGDEVNFELTITNTGNRAGTLRSITVTSTSDKIEYSNNLPDGGLAINGNDTNSVTITAKVKEGAVNGKTSSEVKITYNYDEGSCPDGEILSDDESMCLCPDGLERNETGICVVPEKKIECADDEIYNETKKICEKKVVPTPDKKITPSNPKTLDNIVLVTLLFIVSGLGIYAVMYKKLQTKKQKVTAGVITGVVTLSLSFTVLAGVYGLNNLLGAIVNPITKSKEIIVTVNEEIDLIETWDGECSLDVSELTPQNIFQGGSGTESDPYQVKTAEQLSCFAKSVNNGTTYEGQFVKQTKNIKLNDNLAAQVTAGNLSGAHVWTSIGAGFGGAYSPNPSLRFAGTYDGDNHTISGLYLTDNSSLDGYLSRGLFGDAVNATFKNLVLADVYMNTSSGYTGALLGDSVGNLTVDNVATYGTGNFTGGFSAAGVISYNYRDSQAYPNGDISITNVTNNINLTCNVRCSGIFDYIVGSNKVIFSDDINNGSITYTSSVGEKGGVIGLASTSTSFDVTNCANTGKIILAQGSDNSSRIGGVAGRIEASSATLTDTYNTGDIEYTGSSAAPGIDTIAGVVANYSINNSGTAVVNNVFNSGNFSVGNMDPTVSGSAPSYGSGVIGSATNGSIAISNTYNTGDISLFSRHVAGILSHNQSSSSTITDCYNLGDITAAYYVGGITSEFNGTITKSYNKGDLVIAKGTITGGGIVGGVTNRATIENCYNEGDITATSRNGSGEVGGICPDNCVSIKNSYNRGNIILTTTFSGPAGGITGRANQVSNVYNSGNITYTNTPVAYAGGINGWNGTISNTYNLGNIDVTWTGYSGEASMYLSGIAIDSASNSVNTGAITFKPAVAPTNKLTLKLAGISSSSYAAGSFNAGTITLDESALGTPLRSDGLGHKIYIGEIQSGYNENGSGNKFNTNSNNKALGCLIGVEDGTLTPYEASTCTTANSDATGTYTSESTPSILSIINGDGAFNETLDEDGLPTLKVFNQ